MTDEENTLTMSDVLSGLNTPAFSLSTCFKTVAYFLLVEEPRLTSSTLLLSCSSQARIVSKFTGCCSLQQRHLPLPFRSQFSTKMVRFFLSFVAFSNNCQVLMAFEGQIQLLDQRSDPGTAITSNTGFIYSLME